MYECLAAGTPDEYCLYLNNWEDTAAKGDRDNLSFQPYRYARVQCSIILTVHAQFLSPNRFIRAQRA